MISAFLGGVLLGLVLAVAAVWKERRQRRQARQSDHAGNIEHRRYAKRVDCRFLPDTTLTFVNDAYRRSPANTRAVDWVAIHQLIPEHERDRVLDRIARLRQAAIRTNTPSCRPMARAGITGSIRRFSTNAEAVRASGVEATSANASAGRSTAAVETRREPFSVVRISCSSSTTTAYVDYHAKDAALLFLPASHFGSHRARHCPPIADDVSAITQTSLHDEPVVVGDSVA
jgi:hypothetical protein